LKKTYVTPELLELGEITDITRGMGITGNSDSIRTTVIGKYGQVLTFDNTYGVSG